MKRESFYRQKIKTGEVLCFTALDKKDRLSRDTDVLLTSRGWCAVDCSHNVTVEDAGYERAMRLCDTGDLWRVVSIEHGTITMELA